MRNTEFLRITAVGGIRFGAHLVEDNRNPRSAFLGHFEFGSIDADGHYEQSDEEIIDAARAEFGIEESVLAIVR
jgi:hypothetical protein